MRLTPLATSVHGVPVRPRVLKSLRAGVSTNKTHCASQPRLRVGCARNWLYALHARDVPTQWYPVLAEKNTDTGRAHAVEVSLLAYFPLTRATIEIEVFRMTR